MVYIYWETVYGKVVGACRLLEYIEELNYPKDLYAGRVWPNSPPFRDPENQHYMSYKFYPFQFLPPFIAAGASLLSTNLLQNMSIIAHYTKYVPYDDVFYGKTTPIIFSQ